MSNEEFNKVEKLTYSTMRFVEEEMRWGREHDISKIGKRLLSA